MKKFLIILFTLLLVFTMNITAFAVETETTAPSGDPVIEPNVNVYVTNEIDTTEDLGEYVGTSVYALSPVRPTDATGLKRVMLELIGNYDAIVVEHEYQSNNNYSNYLREIQPDYPWLCSCGLFVVVLFCILRGGFAVLCRL